MPNFFKTGLSKAEILQFFNFYCATAMLSAVYAVVVCLCVCLCVCVSLTLRYCIKMAKYRILQITSHDCPRILFF